MTNFKTYLVTAIELDWDDELDEEGPIDEDIKKILYQIVLENGLHTAKTTS